METDMAGWKPGLGSPDRSQSSSLHRKDIVEGPYTPLGSEQEEVTHSFFTISPLSSVLNTHQKDLSTSLLEWRAVCLPENFPDSFPLPCVARMFR